jgi:hypothetical protein
MKKRFGLIYFVHDDTGEVFSGNTIPTILHEPESDKVKVILIHNQRMQVNKGQQEAVTYRSAVKHVITNDQGFTDFKTLKDNFSRWEDAFVFALDFLQKENYFDRLGLISLSHSNGFVINRNGETLPILSSKTFAASRLGSFTKDLPDNEVLVNASVLEKSTDTDAAVTEALYKPVYTSSIDEFCMTYEGLFFAQFSNFLREELKKFGDKKFSFFISNNCNFQLYDNIFLFSDIAEYTMGSQSYSSVHFWHFPTIVHAIESTLSKGTETMCKLIFQLCIERFRRGNKEIDKHYFLVDCAQFISDLNPFFTIIIDMLIQKIKTAGIRQKLLQGLELLTITSDDKKIPFFDALQFFTRAGLILNWDEFDRHVAKFEGVLQDTSVVVSRFVKDRRKLCGFSLYLPRNREDFTSLDSSKCNYFGRIVKGELGGFAAKTKYDEFLKMLFAW